MQKIQKGGWLAVLICACLLAACTLDRWAGVEAGEYVVSADGGEANLIARREIRKLVVDREAHVLFVDHLDGSRVTVGFAPPERKDWPAGCPGNIYATRMEVLDLEPAQLRIGALTLNDPILVRDCPRNPVGLVLMEAGPVGGGGSACANWQACVFFELP